MQTFFLAGYDGFHGGALALLVAGGIVTALWLVLLAWRWFATFPFLPDAAPATSDLGDEPAAVVNLLCHRWSLTQAALAATLLDLATRGLLAVEQYGGQIVVRAREERLAGQQLTAYEQLLFDHVRSRVRERSAPVEALGLGTEAEAADFWKRFAKAVTGDARRRGLARSRWSREDRVLLGSVLGVALGFVALAFGSAHVFPETATRDGLDPTDWLIAGGVAWAAIMAFVFTRRVLRDTPAGLAVCSRWLGARAYLDETGAFGDMDAAGVTIWGRYLSTAVALGLGHRAAAQLPLAAEDPETAWSRYTGTWRELQVGYPARFGFGQRPLKVFAIGLLRSVFWGALAFVALPIAARAVWDFGSEIVEDPSLRDENIPVLPIVAAFIAVFGIAGINLLARFILGVVWLVRGALDLRAPVVVEGEVVKLYGGRFAVDDGKSDELVAWFAPPAAPAPPLGAHVRVVRSRRLQHVTSVTVTRQSPVPLSPAAGQPAAAPGVGAVDAALVGRLTGLDLAPQGSGGGGTARTAMFADERGNRVVVSRLTLPQAALRAGLGLPGGAAPVAGTLLPGFAGETTWSDGVLLVRSGPQLLQVHVELPGKPEAERREIALALGQAALEDAPAS